MAVKNQHIISAADANSLAHTLHIPVTETQHHFAFRLSKDTHTIVITLLKTGQYIFADLLVDQSAYSIEHVEFYTQETKVEILQEVKEMAELLSTHETRYVCEVKGHKNKMALEFLSENSWTQFGYFNTAQQ